MNELKKEALKNFDQLIGQDKGVDGDNSGGGYVMNLINNVGQNVTIKFYDIHLMYIFHVSS